MQRLRKDSETGVNSDVDAHNILKNLQVEKKLK